MEKYQAVETVNAMANGRHVRLKKDAIVELTEAEAVDLVRAGYVVRVVPLAPETPLERAVPNQPEVLVPTAQVTRRRRRSAGDAAPKQ